MSQPTARAMWIGECLLKALLMEVSAWPKPGLVTPHSQGAHKDMDIWLFITSSSAIAPCFSACAMQGKIIKDRRGNSLQKYVPLAFIMKIRCCGQHSRLIPSAAFFFPARFWRQRQDGFPGAEKPSHITP